MQPAPSHFMSAAHWGCIFLVSHCLDLLYKCTFIVHMPWPLHFSLSLELASNTWTVFCFVLFFSWLSHTNLFWQKQEGGLWDRLCEPTRQQGPLCQWEVSPVSWWGMKYQQLEFLFLSQVGRRWGMLRQGVCVCVFLFLLFFFFKEDWGYRKAAAWTNKKEES